VPLAYFECLHVAAAPAGTHPSSLPFPGRRHSAANLSATRSDRAGAGPEGHAGEVNGFLG